MAEEDEFGFGFDEPAEEEQPSQPQPAQPTPQPQPQPTPTPQPQPAPPQPQPAQRPSTSRAAKGLTPAEAAAENDTLDGIEDALEGAFAMSAPHAQPAGYSSDGEYAGDPNIAPKFAAALEEVPHERSYDSVMLKWGSLRGQIVHELKLQAMPVSDGGGADGDGFSKGYDKARGGVELKVPQPLDTNVMKVHNLRPETRYVFRAVAKNEAGTTRSPDMAAPIQTLRYAPPRGDRSGWLVVLPDRRKSGGTVKTLGRRFSLRGKRGPDRFFFVLDGTLLSWHKAVRKTGARNELKKGGLTRGDTEKRKKGKAWSVPTRASP